MSTASTKDITWLREIKTCKVTSTEGQPVHRSVTPSEAEKRGIKDGDVVSIFNDRGVVLAGAYVTERIMPGVIYIDHDATKWDPIVPGEIDRGGAINTIVPRGTTSKNAVGHAVSGFLADCEKTDMEELKAKYPEAFEKPFHPCAGPSWKPACSTWWSAAWYIDLDLRQFPQLPGGLQGRARRQRLGADREAQPDTGQFWNKITDLERGQVPKVKVTYMHSICQHCDDAPCIPACNVEAIYRRGANGGSGGRRSAVQQIGCASRRVHRGHRVTFNDSLNIAQKCTVYILDDGWTEPRCVDACPTGAFTFGDEATRR